MIDSLQYLDVYMAEADEQLQTMEQEVLRLERGGPSDDAIQRLFRAAHTLKGSSAAMGFEVSRDLTHEMESLLDRLRNKRLSVTKEMVGLLLRCIDELKTLTASIEDGGRQNGAKAAEYVRQLRRFLEAPAAPTAPVAGAGTTAPVAAPVAEAATTAPEAAPVAEAATTVPEAAPETAPSPSSAPSDAGRAALPAPQAPTAAAEPADPVSAAPSSAPEASPSLGVDRVGSASTAELPAVYEVRLHLDPSTEMKAVRAMIIHRDFAERSVVRSVDPALDDIDDAFDGALRLELETTESPEALQRFALSLTGVASADVTAAADATGAAGRTAEEPKGAGAAEPEDGGAGDREAGEAPRSRAKAQTIRMNVERLDALMNLVGELVIEQARIRRIERALRRTAGGAEAVHELGHASDRLTRVVGDLQDGVMKLRMMPVEHVFSRFPRMVRDLAETLGKEVDLIVEGSETELDRTIIDDIADPLIHLIRNAIDHGIERPEDRARAGKPPKGALRVRAFHENDRVAIVVEDDGAGIDPAKVKASAVRKGIVTEAKAAALSDADAIRLIFEPGFSTAAAISDISGRGVGMDIVRSRIEALNGRVDIDSRVGAGTSFRIRLPLTLAIVKGLLVTSGGGTYILPAGAVSEIVRASPEQLQSLQGEEAIVVRDRIVPVVRLHHYLHLPSSGQPKGAIPLVIVQSGERRLAVAVDELIGNQEIVMKSLGSFIGKPDRIAGAAILGDGRVAPILDVNRMIDG